MVFYSFHFLPIFLDVLTKKKPVPHCARSMATGRLSETATIE